MNACTRTFVWKYLRGAKEILKFPRRRRRTDLCALFRLIAAVVVEINTASQEKERQGFSNLIRW